MISLPNSFSKFIYICVVIIFNYFINIYCSLCLYILPSSPLNPMTADRVKWEHIQRVLVQCGRNVSETARRLRMYRRTLQRILNKHA